MKILVTGATGFIGTHLVPHLEQEGHEVWKLVRYISGGRFNYYDDKHTVMADLRDSFELHQAVALVKPEVIIHLAAMSAVSYSFIHPEEVSEVVYLGTVRIAEAAKQCGAWLIHASTSEVYGSSENEPPFVESDKIHGTSPYGAAKVSAEEYLRVLEDTYKVPITVMRPFNTIGRAPMRNRHFVVERAVTQALETGRIQLHDPTPRRDFVFREDHVRAYLSVVKAGRERMAGKTLNICTGEAISIGQMASLVAEKVGKFRGKRLDLSFSAEVDRPLDIPVLQGSNALLLSLTNWNPQYNIDSALYKTIDEWAAVLGLNVR